MRHALHFKDWTGDELQDLLNKAVYMKGHMSEFNHCLEQKTLAMIFQKTSTRTRVSFETGMTKLGGHGIYLDWMKTNFTLGGIRDEIRYVTGNVDMVIARLMHSKDLAEMAQFSFVPVINGCDEKYHPTQAIADYLTLLEKLGSLQGKKLVYVGVWNNTLNSLIDVGYKTGVHVVAVCPVVNEAAWDAELVAKAEQAGLLTKSLDLKEACKDADAVYTDSWVDMEFFNDPKYEKEKNERLETMMPYQMNRRNIGDTKALIMHDMPMHVGYEIDRELIEDKNSIIFPQGWNRMWGEMALVCRLFGVI
jgi:ornithine carbamoyltransferase